MLLFKKKNLIIYVLALICTALMLCFSFYIYNNERPAHADTCQYHVTPLPVITSATNINAGTYNYYLTGDTTISNQFVINSGATVNLCLNGYMLTVTSGIAALNVTGGTLNLYDCGGDGQQKHYYTKDSTTGRYVFGSGSDYISGGVICNANTTGQTIYVGSGTFNMYGGTIAGSYGGLNSFGTVNIYDGKICGNGTYDSIYNGGTMNLYGGEITDNGANGIRNMATLTLQGDVKIYGNSTRSGATGVYDLYAGKGTIEVGSAGLSPNAYIGIALPTGQNYSDGTFFTNNSGQSTTDLLSDYFFDDTGACYHSYGTLIPQQDETCTADGMKAHYQCTKCGKYFDENKSPVAASSLVIPALGHNYSVTWQWASDYSIATATYVCANCGDTGTLMATPTSTKTDPTCTVDGKIVYTATVTLPDGTTETDTQTETLPATGHSYQITGWQWASDYSIAILTYTCSVCGDTNNITVTPTNVRTDPDCTTDGNIVYTATATLPDGTTDTDTQTVNLPALGHSYSVTWQWATDYSSATATYVCANCGDTGTLAATPTSVKTDPDCTTDGNIVYTATVTLPDGTTETDTATDTIPATGHSYQVTGWVWASDYSSATATYVCSVCGDTGTVTGTPSYVQTDPTCDVDGLIGYTVTVTLPDGTTATDNNGQTLPAKGHQWDSGTVVPPTCTDDGYTEYTCGVCGDTKQEDIVPATGHTYQFSGWNWADDYSSASVEFVCSVCGDKITYPADSITFVDDEEQGTRTYTATAVIDSVTYTDEQTIPIPAPIVSGCMGCAGGIDWLLILCIGMLLFDVVMFAITMRVICSKPKDDEDEENDEEQDGDDNEYEFY